MTGIRSFAELAGRFGTGRGCAVCKPAVASMFASLSSGHILDGEQASLQDTNDHFLANIQRDGTYSVIPRIPGGEITPEGLIAIGEVARDFDLYCKITGGQRVDLLGATVDQLPLIWARLIDAGFESGHAYGKAMRTVKSCIGSVWCRYGVQDSVQLAIDLELRYRGLRAPHKIKLAVSGCARECAEAQSKDVGVIATERGWNLYVGGNGGMRPRHAQLLAEDLDSGTLLATIDRFLMYYIRTADRLERTASWLEKIDGGIDHVRAVVIEDSPRPGPRPRRRHGPPRRHLRVRVEGHARRPGAAGQVPVLLQQRGARPRPHLRAGARAAAAGMTLVIDTDAWVDVGRTADLMTDRGIGRARRRPPGGRVPARRRLDPRHRQPRPDLGANVLSRGIVGDRAGVPVVASPIYKQCFELATGRCLDDPWLPVQAHHVRDADGRLLVRLGTAVAGARLTVVELPLPTRRRPAPPRPAPPSPTASGPSCSRSTRASSTGSGSRWSRASAATRARRPAPNRTGCRPTRRGGGSARSRGGPSPTRSASTCRCRATTASSRRASRAARPTPTSSSTTGSWQHHADECIGCQYCTWNCPYSVPAFQPDRKIVTKCDMCLPRLEEGRMPACVDACPTFAITVEKVDVEAWRADHSAGERPQPARRRTSPSPRRGSPCPPTSPSTRTAGARGRSGRSTRTGRSCGSPSSPRPPWGRAPRRRPPAPGRSRPSPRWSR